MKKINWNKETIVFFVASSEVPLMLTALSPAIDENGNLFPYCGLCMG